MSEPEFYFALPRLIAKLSGKSARRGEHNALEAHGGGAVIFVISYLLGAQSAYAHAAGWQVATLLLLLLFATWIFWLVVLYINTLILKGMRAVGCFRRTPDVKVQSVLIGTVATIFAAELCRRGSWPAAMGIIWIAAVLANLAAAMVLMLTNADGHARD